LPQYTVVSGIPITKLLPQDRIDAIVARTRKGGGELVKLMGTSAWNAPGASAALMARSIIRDEKQLLPCSAHLTGQYGLDDVYIGAPCKLGKDGVEEILELELSEAEQDALNKSAEEVRTGIAGLQELKLL
jgi:malate dehydrogenase